MPTALVNPRRAARVWAVIPLLGLGLLTGCPSDSNITAAPRMGGAAASIHGAVFGARQPVKGATIVAYAAGSATNVTPLELGSGTTDSSGQFSIAFTSTPAPNQIVYFVVTGGDAGGGANSAIGMMAVAGAYCDTGTAGCAFPASVTINELTTVASTAALQSYIRFADCAKIGENTRTGTCLSIPYALGLPRMTNTVANLVNAVTGKASDFIAGQPADSALHATLEKMNTLASVLAACVHAADPAEDACKNLFAAALGNPADTLKAAWLIATSPVINAQGQALYALKPTTPTFTPTLATAPANWTVAGRRFAIIANHDGGNVSSYALGSGALTPISGSPFSTGSFPVSIAAEPSGRYVYVGREGGVSAYRIDSGVLISIGGRGVGGDPQSLATDPSGRYVYVAQAQIRRTNGSNNVSALKINGDGTLTNIGDFAAGQKNQDLLSVAVEPTGRYVYATTVGIGPKAGHLGHISEYTIGADGGLGIIGTLVTGRSPTSVTVDPTGRYVYVAISLDDKISAYKIGADGLLTGVPDSPFVAGSGPVSVAIDPTGRYVYVANRGDGSLSAYTLDSATGALAALPGPHFIVGTSALAVTVDPMERYVYVTNANTTRHSTRYRLSVYALDPATGALTAVPGSPLATGRNPNSVMADPTGRYVYVGNGTENNVSAYKTGDAEALTAVNGSPFAAGSQARAVIMDPAGRYVYVANHASNDVSAYTLDPATGALAALPGSPFGAGSNPLSAAMDPGGRYVYVANHASNDVSAYRIGAGGILVAVPGSPFAAGNGPSAVTVDPTGHYVYVANFFDRNVTAYTIGTGGTLAVMPGSPFTAGSHPMAVTTDPTGRYAYVANALGNSVSAYTIGSGGVLTAVPGSPFAAGIFPNSVTVDPTGRYAYAVNAGDNTVSAYTIGSGGALTAVRGSPFATGKVPFSLEVDPTGHYAYVANRVGDTISVYTIGSGGALASFGTYASGSGPRSIVTGP